MDLDELQTVQSRERQTDSLQQLRASFYQEAGEFIQQLERERERAAERADDPWDAPEVNRLTDDIKTARQTVEFIYERRIGKLVKMASLAAADMQTEDDAGLTEEEERLFEALVGAIEDNRDHVMAVLDGEDPGEMGELGPPDAATPDAGSGSEATQGAADPTPGREREQNAAPDPEQAAAPDPEQEPAPGREREPEPEGDAGPRPADEASAIADEDGPEEADHGQDGEGPSGTGTGTDAPGGPGGSQSGDGDGEPTEIDAADLMGGGTDPSYPADAGGGPEVPDRDRGADQTGTSAGAGGSRGERAATSPAADPEDGSSGSDATAGASVDRHTVRITGEVGEIYGVDDREYDLSEDDVVRLPAANAEPLVQNGVAERID